MRPGARRVFLHHPASAAARAYHLVENPGVPRRTPSPMANASAAATMGDARDEIVAELRDLTRARTPPTWMMFFPRSARNGLRRPRRPLFGPPTMMVRLAASRPPSHRRRRAHRAQTAPRSAASAAKFFGSGRARWWRGSTSKTALTHGFHEAALAQVDLFHLGARGAGR